jgi:hypothetical protein
VLLGAAPAAILTRFAKTLPARLRGRLWNSAVATLTMGFLVRAGDQHFRAVYGL